MSYLYSSEYAREGYYYAAYSGYSAGYGAPSAAATLEKKEEEKQQSLESLRLTADGRDLNEEFQLLLSNPTTTPEERGERLARLSEFTQSVAVRALPLARTIILEKEAPEMLRTIHRLHIGGVAGGAKYAADGLFLKFVNNEHGVYESEEQAGKAARLELAALRAVIQAEIEHLSVPLVLLISFLGHRLFISTMLPIGGENTLVHGSSDGGRTVVSGIDAHFDEIAAELGRRLHLKEHPVGREPNVHRLFLPADAEGHRGYDGRLYVLDLARCFPPETPSSKSSHLTRLLRPELLAKLPGPLSSDCFSAFATKCAESRINNAEARSATKYLLDTCVPEAATEISDKQPQIHALKGILHSHGVNMRHLGLVRRLLEHDERGKAMTEMVARTLRKLIEKEWRETPSPLESGPLAPYVAVVQRWKSLLLGADRSEYWCSDEFKLELVKRFLGGLSEEELGSTVDVRTLCSSVGDVESRLMHLIGCTGPDDMTLTPRVKRAVAHIFSDLRAGGSFSEFEVNRLSKLYSRQLEIQEALGDPSSLRLVAPLLNLAKVKAHLQSEFFEAKVLFERARDLLSDPLAKADVTDKIFEAAIKHGLLEEAEEAVSEGWSLREGADDAQLALSHCLFARLKFAAGKHAAALKSARDALDLLPEGLERAKVELVLAEITREMGSYAEALAQAKRTLESIQRRVPARHSLRAQCLDQISRAHQKLGRFQAAELLTKEALNIRSEVLGQLHSETLSSLCSLAYIQGSLSKYSEAAMNYKATLQGLERTLGPTHPQVAEALVHKSWVLAKLGHVEDAMAGYKTALDIQREKLGSQHPAVAYTLTEMSSLYISIGQFAKGKAAAQLSLEAVRSTYGETHRETARVVAVQARLHYMAGDYLKALAAYGEALHLMEATVGLQHIIVVDPLVGLSQTHYRLGNYLSAKNGYTQAIDVLRNVLPDGQLEGHPLAISVWKSFAYLYGGLGNFDKAHKLYSYCFRCASEGLLRAEQADVEGKLGWIEMRRGEPATALKHFLSSLKLACRVYGETEAAERDIAQLLSAPVAHPTVASILSNTAELLLAYPELQTSELDPMTILGGVYNMQITKLYPGGMHVEVGYTLKLEGEALKILGKLEEAREKFSSSLTTIAHALGEQHVRTAGARLALAQLHIVSKQPELAVPLLQDAMAVFSGAPWNKIPKLQEEKVDDDEVVVVSPTLKLSTSGIDSDDSKHPSYQLCVDLLQQIKN